MRVTSYHRGSWAILSTYKYLGLLRTDVFVLCMQGEWMQSIEEGYVPVSKEMLKVIKEYEKNNCSDV